MSIQPNDNLTGQCVYCGRSIVKDNGIWIDPEVTGDDSIWRASLSREICDAHDTFTAEHIPKATQPSPAAVEELGYAEAKEQFASQGSFSSGRTYTDEELSEAYDRGANRAEAEAALAERQANSEKISATVQAARASATHEAQYPNYKELAAYAHAKELDKRHAKDEWYQLAKANGEACVNAMAENKRLKQERDALQAQRDELLAAITDFDKAWCNNACDWKSAAQAKFLLVETAEAIARATEGGKGQ